MKKIRAVFGYFIMSAALFLGGVSLDSGVSGTDVIADLRDRLDNMDDPADRADDPRPARTTRGSRTGAGRTTRRKTQMFRCITIPFSMTEKRSTMSS